MVIPIRFEDGDVISLIGVDNSRLEYIAVVTAYQKRLKKRMIGVLEVLHTMCGSENRLTVSDGKSHAQSVIDDLVVSDSHVQDIDERVTVWCFCTEKGGTGCAEGQPNGQEN